MRRGVFKGEQRAIPWGEGGGSLMAHAQNLYCQASTIDRVLRACGVSRRRATVHKLGSHHRVRLPRVALTFIYPCHVHGRYKLVPEGVAREVDVPARRCAIVEGATMRRGGESADDEVFDIPDGS